MVFLGGFWKVLVGLMGVWSFLVLQFFSGFCTVEFR